MSLRSRNLVNISREHDAVILVNPNSPTGVYSDAIKNIVLEINDTDLVWVPRINIVNGITDWHMEHWGWRQTEQGWINFPDYQARIFRNTDNIKWIKPVHEVIDGAKTYAHLPPQEELTLKHEKEINKQEQQNRLYDSII